jgi:hypothetical protein
MLTGRAVAGSPNLTHGVPYTTFNPKPPRFGRVLKTAGGKLGIGAALQLCRFWLLFNMICPGARAGAEQAGEPV